MYLCWTTTIYSTMINCLVTVFLDLLTFWLRQLRFRWIPQTDAAKNQKFLLQVSVNRTFWVTFDLSWAGVVHQWLRICTWNGFVQNRSQAHSETQITAIRRVAVSSMSVCWLYCDCHENRTFEAALPERTNDDFHKTQSIKGASKSLLDRLLYAVRMVTWLYLYAKLS